MPPLASNVTTPPPSDPLASLRDIHSPEPISSLPAVGWWLLGGIALIAISAITLLLWRRWQSNRYRRQALAHVTEIEQSNQTHQQQRQRLNQLLKRTALSVYPRHLVSGLYGQAWCELLDRSLGKKACSGSERYGLELYDANTQDSTIEAKRLQQAMKFARYWIQKHQQQWIPPAAIESLVNNPNRNISTPNSIPAAGEQNA